MSGKGKKREVLEERIEALSEKVDYKYHSIQKQIYTYVACIGLVIGVFTFIGNKTIKSLAKETTKEIVEKLAGKEFKKYATDDYAEKLLFAEFEDKLDKKTREILLKLDKTTKKGDNILESIRKRGNEFLDSIEKGQHTFDEWHQKGLKEYKNQNYSSVVTYMSKARGLDTGQVDVYLKRGDAYGRLKQYESAIEDYHMAIELDPENAVAYEGISVLNIIMGNYKVAKESIIKALSLPLENKNKTIFHYLECIVNKLLDEDTLALEAKLNKSLGVNFAIEQSFDLIESWLKDADIPDKAKNFIAGKTNMIKWKKDMVFIPGGCFEMGDIFGDGVDVEMPVHEVCVKDFYMRRYEVTVGEFRRFVDKTKYKTEVEKEGYGLILTSKGDSLEVSAGADWRNPGFPQNDSQPVVLISWNDAKAYIEWLSSREGKEYRLPTEAEWEYAARSGGKKYKYSWRNESPEGNIAGEEVKVKFPERPWPVWESYEDEYVFTAPVGNSKSNELGLYDMTGNVWEWCSDWYDSDYYKSSSKGNPEGPSSGDYKVLRGGSWLNTPRAIRVSYRIKNKRAYTRDDVGFRLAVSAQ